MYLQGQQGIVSDLMDLTRVLRGLKESCLDSDVSFGTSRGLTGP